MKDTSHMLIIARREFMERARSRVFQITLAVIVLVIIGGLFALSFVNAEPEALQLGVGGDSPPGIVADIEGAAIALEVDAVVTDFGSADEARQAVEAGDVRGALVNGNQMVFATEASPTATAIFTAAANSAVRREVAADLGLTEDQVGAILVPVQVGVEILDPEEPEETAELVASMLGAILLLTTIMMFGQFVAMGIVEEKQNRVIEVILAKARTTSLLIGKVLGIGTLGLIQVAAIGGAVVVGLLIAPFDSAQLPDLTGVGVTAVLWIGFWFILGYLVYSFLYAMLGATISRQEDMQSIAFIPAMLILPGYFLVTFSLGSGISTIARVGSFFPFWAPILMPFRLNTGDAALWEVALSVALVVVTIVVLVRVGAKVYRGAALKTGAKVSLREAWQSAGE